MPIVTALVTGAALLLTACGGSGSDESPDKIEGAGQGDSTPAPSKSGAKTPDADRPKITLPKSFNLPFEGWTSSDPAKQAVLDDGKEHLRAGYAAIIAKDPDAESLAFYDTTAGLSQDQRWIKTYTDKDLTVFGKLPVFDPEVTLAGEKKSKATLTYCTDESKAYSKERKSGKTEGNPAGTAPEVFYTLTLAKNAEGVWQTVSTYSKRGGCSR
ncbi:hypothetical protein [Streptomyces longisporoflavus]|uniref:hypothetical protein n=1 Tax=Streptomyces longisporoflavus TaxID=28044 RepID=UPI001E56E0EE|nr:hypothetical protein [Streptomyces longisporoflavus]